MLFRDLMNFRTDNRTFLARGGNIYVHKPGEDKVVKAFELGGTFTPTKMNLRNKDSRATFMSPDSSTLANYDVQSGKLLEQLVGLDSNAFTLLENF